MARDIPLELNSDINRPVLDHLHGKSAHSDVSDALRAALQTLGDVQEFCPNPMQYRYVIAATAQVIFAFAVGMSSVGFRLDERMKNRALATGAVPQMECGPEWVVFQLFRDDWPQVDLEFWARKAYCAARESRR